MRPGHEQPTHPHPHLHAASLVCMLPFRRIAAEVVISGSLGLVSRKRHRPKRSALRQNEDRACRVSMVALVLRTGSKVRQSQDHRDKRSRCQRA